MSEVSPPDGSSKHDYHSQYAVSPSFRKFWEKGFHGAALTDKEIGQLTDGFFRNLTDQMNYVMNNALKAMKKLEAKRKEEEGG